MNTYLITGGAGFIGSNFVRYILEKYDEKVKIVVLDKLTYAGNINNIKDMKAKIKFIKGDICNRELVEHIFSEYDVNYIVNFAAESHVDRSIEEPKIFLETNILGTQNLLECAKYFWTIGKDEYGYPIYKNNVKYLQVSTDEVYGTLKKDYTEAVKMDLEKDIKIVAKDRENIKTYGKDFFYENTPLDPRSPYSASKTSADMIVKAYSETYKLPINITRCSNNYGPYHFPEKLIPLIIKNIINGKKLPVYGEGKNVRDWLYVKDHAKAIDIVVNKGKVGEIYNIGGFNEEENINIVKIIIDKIKKYVNENKDYENILKIKKDKIDYNLIEYVQDRLGHDMRYAINPAKIVKELGWYPETTFEKGIEETIKWYLDNQSWIENIVNGNYKLEKW